MLKALQSLLSSPPQNPERLYSQARMLREPIGVPGYDKKDLFKARQYFALAAGAGHAGSAFMLGIMLTAGEGGPADIQQGLALIEHAAKLGNDDAQFHLGMQAEQAGRTTEALHWYDLSAATHPMAQQRRNYLRSAMQRSQEGKFCVGHPNHSLEPKEYAGLLVSTAYLLAKRTVDEYMMDMDDRAEWDRLIPAWSKVAADQVAPVHIAACAAYINHVLRPSVVAMDAFWAGIDQGLRAVLPDEGLVHRTVSRIYEIARVIESQDEESFEACLRATIAGMWAIFEGLWEFEGAQPRRPSEAESRRITEMLAYAKTMAVWGLEQLPLTWRAD